MKQAIVPATMLSKEKSHETMPVLPVSTSPNAYPFDSMAQVERLKNEMTSTELVRLEGVIVDTEETQRRLQEVSLYW